MFFNSLLFTELTNGFIKKINECQRGSDQDRFSCLFSKRAESNRGTLNGIIVIKHLIWAFFQFL